MYSLEKVTVFWHALLSERNILTSLKVGEFASQRLTVFMSNCEIPRHNPKAGGTSGWPINLRGTESGSTFAMGSTLGLMCHCSTRERLRNSLCPFRS